MVLYLIGIALKGHEKTALKGTTYPNPFIQTLKVFVIHQNSSN